VQKKQSLREARIDDIYHEEMSPFMAALSRETKTTHLGQSQKTPEIVSGIVFLPLAQHFAQLICPVHILST
jgi:hypothetical protein